MRTSSANVSGPSGPVGAGMLCPRCQVDLVMSERQGIEVDYCPKCRGVWLDRGELDKIIERNSQYTAPQDQAPPQPPPSAWIAPLQSAAPPPPGYQAYGDGRDDDDGRRRGHGSSDYGGKRRKSWLGELFD